MKIISCKGENVWVTQINAWLDEQYKTFVFRSLFLPAGNTPIPLYCNWEVQHHDFLANIRMMQIDEILSGVKKMEFKKFFQNHLPSYQQQLDFIDGAENCADVSLLGLGLNGHIAFHEPGVSDGLYSGCLYLNKETTGRLKTEERTQVITYGLQAFLRSKAIALIVRGESKRTILNDILNRKIVVPATRLLEHKNLVVITDFD